MRKQAQLRKRPPELLLDLDLAKKATLENAKTDHSFTGFYSKQKKHNQQQLPPRPPQRPGRREHFQVEDALEERLHTSADGGVGVLLLWAAVYCWRQGSSCVSLELFIVTFFIQVVCFKVTYLYKHSQTYKWM